MLAEVNSWTKSHLNVNASDPIIVMMGSLAIIRVSWLCKWDLYFRTGLLDFDFEAAKIRWVTLMEKSGRQEHESEPC